jgi:hypothetical protein
MQLSQKPAPGPEVCSSEIPGRKVPGLVRAGSALIDGETIPLLRGRLKIVLREVLTRFAGMAR